VSPTPESFDKRASFACDDDDVGDGDVVIADDSFVRVPQLGTGAWRGGGRGRVAAEATSGIDCLLEIAKQSGSRCKIRVSDTDVARRGCQPKCIRVSVEQSTGVWVPTVVGSAVSASRWTRLGVGVLRVVER
jgi:hypothetical protein